MRKKPAFSMSTISTSSTTDEVRKNRKVSEKNCIDVDASVTPPSGSKVVGLGHVHIKVPYAVKATLSQNQHLEGGDEMAFNDGHACQVRRMPKWRTTQARLAKSAGRRTLQTHCSSANAKLSKRVQGHVATLGRATTKTVDEQSVSV